MRAACRGNVYRKPAVGPLRMFHLDQRVLEKRNQVLFRRPRWLEGGQPAFIRLYLRVLKGPTSLQVGKEPLQLPLEPFEVGACYEPLHKGAIQGRVLA